MSDRIYLSPPQLTGKEREYLLQALDSNWIAPVGPFVDRFEQALRDYSGLPGAVVLNSGTSALHLALRLIGVGPGDEVICPTFTFIASAAPVTYLGAQPVFVDCELGSWNMDPQALDDAIVQRRRAGARVKAVVFAYCYGMPGRMDEILDICHRHNLPLVEDAAEAMGSTWNGRPAGTLGIFGIYSFNGNKIITTSAGGALVTPDLELARRAKKLASQAKEPTPHFEHHEIGYNYGMSNLLAALGLAQLEGLTEKVRQRRAIFDAYRNQLERFPGFLWQHEPESARSNRWLSCFAFQDEKIPTKLQERLKSRNAEWRPLWKPLHSQPCFSGARHFGASRSDILFASGICLPSGQSSAAISDLL